MDKVLDKLADIENTASGIMEEANKRKSQFAQEMDEKTRAFDQELEKETQNRIRQVQETMELDMNQKLKEQKERSDRLLLEMETNYKEHRKEYVEELFKEMIKE